ncbi:MAG: hemolysin secretion protein D, partial [Brevundimonas sp.]
MPGFLKNKWLWIGLLLIIVAVAGFSFVSSQGAAKKKAVEEAAATVTSPYAAVANGKVDVEGGIIQVAARRGGVVREVLVQEGDAVVARPQQARPPGDEPRPAGPPPPP